MSFNKLKLFLDKFLSLLFILSLLLIGWILLQVTVFASFKIPTDSMEPALVAGDNILVNKLYMGGRLFNLWRSDNKGELEVYRLPSFSEIKRNDVVVFNFPYIGAWDSIALNLKKYYVKRCVALPGDTFSIKDGRYVVSGYKGNLGNMGSQRELSRIASSGNVDNYGIVMKGFPYNDLIKWDIANFGPLYIPAKGATVNMDYMNSVVYKRVIEWEQKKKLVTDSCSVMLGDSVISEYTFLRNYYFVAGDKCVNSQDSRYWGFLPENYIVGKVWLIWKSINPVTNKFNWERVFKIVE